MQAPARAASLNIERPGHRSRAEVAPARSGTRQKQARKRRLFRPPCPHRAPNNRPVEIAFGLTWGR
jgi:hypothetical protein